MLTPISTYPFFAKAGHVPAHWRGRNNVTANESVTLAGRHAV